MAFRHLIALGTCCCYCPMLSLLQQLWSPFPYNPPKPETSQFIVELGRFWFGRAVEEKISELLQPDSAAESISRDRQVPLPRAGS